MHIICSWFLMIATVTVLRGRLASSLGNKNASNGTEIVSSAVFQLALFSKDGSHHIRVYVGEPPQVQTLILDTGSRYTAWKCYPCKGCNGDETDALKQPTSLRQAANRQQQKSEVRGGGGERQSKHFNYFHPSLSSTLQNVSCGECLMVPNSSCSQLATTSRGGKKTPPLCIVNQRYTEGSKWTAYEVSDFVTLVGGHTPGVDHAAGSQKSTSLISELEKAEYGEYLPNAVPFVFGCQTDVEGMFQQQHASGIWGLEGSWLDGHSLLITMVAEGVLPDTSFSLCLSPTGGLLGLSGPNLDRHFEPMYTTPLLQSVLPPPPKDPDGPILNAGPRPGMYSVIVDEVWLNNVCLTSSTINPQIRLAFHEGKGTLLDSGTTDSYLPKALGPVFRKTWKRETGHDYIPEQSQWFSLNEFRRLPTIRLVFRNNVTLSITPEHYMEGALDHMGELVHNSNPARRLALSNRLYVDESVGAVVGSNAMFAHDIYFDGANNRVGIARADCRNYRKHEQKS